MTRFQILQATQRPVNGHLIGVIDSGADDGGYAFLGVRHGDTVEQFRIKTGEVHELNDGWTIRLIGVTAPTSERGKAILQTELLEPGIGGGS
jgi:hypothetical protein